MAMADFTQVQKKNSKKFTLSLLASTEMKLSFLVNVAAHRVSNTLYFWCFKSRYVNKYWILSIVSNLFISDWNTLVIVAEVYDCRTVL